MYKITSNIEARKRLRLKNGFQAFRANAFYLKVDQQRKLNKKKLVE
jgi:hypothetical protein